jgi:ubiquinone/menaquinone biosynthesis C-methylase UbiE
MLNDPFQTGRNAARLLFDFSVGISFIDFSKSNKKILDIACGTGWTSEFLNKLGLDVYGFDIDKEVIKLAKTRYLSDKRISREKLHLSTGDCHRTKYADNFFGHIFCFDSFHHMKKYEIVLKEFFRVVEGGGKVIFVEPGSRHADSVETREFISKNPHTDYWIEKNVDLLSIYNLSKSIGFNNMTIKPYNDPAIVSYSFIDWYNILDNKEGIKNQINELRRFNYEDRIIFSIEKPL